MATSILPLSVLKPRFLATVPESARNMGSRGKRTESYNVAAWLVLERKQENSVALVLSYHDEKGEQAAIVDEVTVLDGVSLMLSGRVDLPVNGVISDMAIWCTGVDASTAVRVDELFVQAIAEKRPDVKAS